MNSPNARVPLDLPGAEEVDATLRLLASLPTPSGLEDRVKTALRAAPRTSKVLPWPGTPAPSQGWLRIAAAAAIVFVVAGGGWGVYTHVQPAQATQAVAVPHVAAPGGFSSAGAMRTPQTLNGPVLKHPGTATQKHVTKPVSPDKKAAADGSGTGNRKHVAKKPLPQREPQAP